MENLAYPLALGPNLSFNIILETISLVSMFYKHFSKLASQVLETQVLSGGNLRWKKSTRGTQVLETRVPQNKTKRKKNTKHREKSINFELVPSFLKRFFFLLHRQRERERERQLS